MTANQDLSVLSAGLSERIRNIEIGIKRLSHRSGRQFDREEVKGSSDSGIITIVRYIDPVERRSVAEYEVRNDPLRILIRMRGLSG